MVKYFKDLIENRDKTINIALIVAGGVLALYLVWEILEAIAKIPPSIVTLFMGIIGLGVALHKHKENIELKKKEDLIVKQQQLASQIIDDTQALRNIFARIYLGSTILTEADKNRLFYNVKNPNDTQKLAMSQLAWYINNYELISRVQQYASYVDIYFPQELIRILAKINGLTVAVKVYLETLVSDDLYPEEWISEEHKNSILGQRNTAREITFGTKNLENLNNITDEIKFNLAKYLFVDMIRWEELPTKTESKEDNNDKSK